MTIHQIDPKFFKSSALQFFEQKPEDFKLFESGGRVFIYAPSVWAGRLMAYTAYEYVEGEMFPVDVPARVRSGASMRKHLTNLSQKSTS